MKIREKIKPYEKYFAFGKKAITFFCFTNLIFGLRLRNLSLLFIPK